MLGRFALCARAGAVPPARLTRGSTARARAEAKRAAPDRRVIRAVVLWEEVVLKRPPAGVPKPAGHHQHL